MQKRSRRLQTVVKLARLRQRLAAEQLGESSSNAESQQMQLQQLKRYQQDYGDNFKALAAAGSNPSQLINYQRFMANLDQAAVAQSQRAVLAEDQRERARADWQQLYSREKSLDKLVQRTRQEEDREEEGKRQREQDDRRPIEPMA